ncbi:MAG: iron chaperone [Actinomycetes bacterium]
MGAVDDSLAAMSEPDRSYLQRVISIARGIAPDAEEGMSYGMPALRLDGKPLIGVAAAAKHLSIFPFSPEVVDAVAPRLEGYSLSKGTVRFTPDHPVPDDVVAEMVRLRMAEIRK